MEWRKRLDPTKDKVLILKIEKILTSSSESLIGYFQEFFVTADTINSKYYWGREFDEVQYLESFLESVTFTIMETMFTMSDSMAQILDSFLEKEGDNLNLNKNKKNDLINPNMILNKLVPRRRSMDEPTNYKENEANNPGLNGIGGLGVYIILKRLSSYSRMSSDEKHECLLEIFSKTHIILNIVEKILFFEQASVSFRKYKYLEVFN